MSDSGDDVFTRLSGILDGWSAQIAQSHEELSTQIGAARGHLDRLLSNGSASIETTERAGREEIATLAAEVDRLNAALASARAEIEAGAAAQHEAAAAAARISELEEEISNAQGEIAAGAARESALREQLDSMQHAGEEAASDAAGEFRERISELEAALASAHAELATHAETSSALKEELDAANEQIEILAEQLRDAKQAPSADGDAEALQSALDLLQLEHAAAQDEIRALKQSLNDGAPGGPGIDAFDARGHKKRMGEILVELGVLTQVQLKSLLKEQSQDPQRRLGAIAVEHGYTSEELVSRILAAQLRLPFEDLQRVEPEPHAMQKVSPHVVLLHRCMPLQEEGGVLTVAMVNPLDLIAIEDLELASRCRVAPVVSTRSQIEGLISVHYPEAS